MLNPYEKRMLNRELKVLLQATEGCRDSMHEPDMTAFLVGTHMDNAWGEGPPVLKDGWGEYAEQYLGLYPHESARVHWFNLADLIALARMAKIEE